MQNYVADAEDLSVAAILNKAVYMAKILPKLPKIKVPGNSGFKNDIDELFTFIRTKPNGMTITPSSMNEWLVQADRIGNLSNVTVSLSIQTSTLGPYYGIAKIINPRIELTESGEVDFGGTIVYKGLSNNSPVRSRKEVANCLYEVLMKQEPYVLKIQYNLDEAKACLSKRTKKVLGDKVKIILDESIEEDEVSVPERWYENKLQDNSVFIFAEVSGDTGLSGCYKAVPSNHPAGTIGLGSIPFMNLAMSYETEHNGLISTVNLQHPQRLVVRPRVDKSNNSFNIKENEFKEALSKYNVLTTGHVYSLKENFDFYFDVLEISPGPACTLTDTQWSNKEISLEINYDLFKQYNPLDTSEHNDDTEESDTEESSD